MWPLKVLFFFFCLLASAGAEVRALLAVHHERLPRSTRLVANTGWQTLYLRSLEVQPGDVVYVVGQTQLTLDSGRRVGQQLRLTVNGQVIGAGAMEFNEQPGSHHLPMLASAVLNAEAEGTLLVGAEASAFHVESNLEVKVDQSDNHDYGGLIIEHYRCFPTQEEACKAGALLLAEHHRSSPTTLDRVAVQPYLQEAIGTLELELEEGDLLRVYGQTVGVARWGLEMFAGVLAYDGRAVSPYGGLNVAVENLFAPLRLEGLVRTAQTAAKLEFRVYGGFGRGLALYPQATLFECLRFSARGRALLEAAACELRHAQIASNQGYQELAWREIELKEGDVIRLAGTVQFASAGNTQRVECRAQLAVSGPDGQTLTFSQKNLDPHKPALALGGSLAHSVTKTGRYRVSLGASGFCDSGGVVMNLEPQLSQLQFFHYGTR